MTDIAEEVIIIEREIIQLQIKWLTLLENLKEETSEEEYSNIMNHIQTMKRSAWDYQVRKDLLLDKMKKFYGQTYESNTLLHEGLASIR
ncbi:MAG: hypothetical protein WD512_05975 [Candidatus Paceibacterota bacterium]